MSGRPFADVAPRAGRAASLPNLLSLFRIGLVPVLVVVLFWPGRAARAAAGLLFVVACLTDFFDGWLARRSGITTLGKFLDPLADKLIVVAALIMLAAMPPEPRVPAWMAVVIACRELAVTGLRGIAAQQGIVMAAEALGKYKMIFQMFARDGPAGALHLARSRHRAERGLPRRRHAVPVDRPRPGGVVRPRLLRPHHAPSRARLMRPEGPRAV